MGRFPAWTGPEARAERRLLIAQQTALQGFHAEAESLMQRSINVLENAYGPEHPMLRYPLELYSLILRDLGREREAKDVKASRMLWPQTIPRKRQQDSLDQMIDKDVSIFRARGLPVAQEMGLKSKSARRCSS